MLRYPKSIAQGFKMFLFDVTKVILDVTCMDCLICGLGTTHKLEGSDWCKRY